MNVAFTTATANYLSQAKAVADSFLVHNPDFKFIIVLLDKINNRFDTGYFSPSEIVEIESFKIPVLHEMVNRYTIFELSNALKPFVADHLFKENQDLETLLYFDSDILIYNSFTEVHELLKKFDIIITPHFHAPPPFDGLLLDETSFLNTGIYNAGFFALNQSKDALSFLSWWKKHMEVECFIDLSKGLFVDQIWLNFVPLYYEKACILKNMAYNVAYWNLHERVISYEKQQYFVNKISSLVFFHFSGFSINSPGEISVYQTRYNFNQRPDILPLFKKYKDILLDNNYDYYSALSCYYVELKQQWKQDEREKEEMKLPYINKVVKSLKQKVKYRIKPLLSKR